MNVSGEEAKANGLVDALGGYDTALRMDGDGQHDATSARALLDALPPEAIANYGPNLEQLFATTEEQERTGMPVERVSDAIAHALTAAKPRAKYLLGGPARAASIVAILPATIP